MSSTFPSVLTTYTDPQATDKLNSPSHSGIEQNQNSGIKQLERVIGVEGPTSVVGTLEYLIKSPGSDGGGHVQVANKGGTGQTQYAKGDILIASSSSVLSKLSLGADGLSLVADSTQSLGVKWAGAAGYAVASVISASVYAIEIQPAPTALAAGQAYAVKWPTTNINSVIGLTVSSITAARIKKQDLTNLIPGDIQSSMIGLIEYDGSQFQLVTPFIPNTPFISSILVSSAGSGTIAIPPGTNKVIVNAFKTHAGDATTGNTDSGGQITVTPQSSVVTVTMVYAGSSGGSGYTTVPRDLFRVNLVSSTLTGLTFTQQNSGAETTDTNYRITAYNYTN